jgi:hypothetical protein
MRDDPRVRPWDYLAIFLALATVASAIDGAFRFGVDGPTWRLRWRGLDPGERARISAAARSNAELTDPADAELAKGFNRYERRRRARLEVAFAPLILVAAALVLTRVLPFDEFGLVATAGLWFSLWVSPWLIKRRDGTARRATSPDAGL